MIDVVGKAVEVAGVAVIVIGMGVATWRFVWNLHRNPDRDNYRRCRHGVGRAILLGLEFLVAGDIIRTVAVTPTFASVGVLAAIVAIRTFLSFSLEVELEGRWPWSRERPPRRHDDDREPAQPGGVSRPDAKPAGARG